MSSKTLDVTWYRDRAAIERGEPGIPHSFLSALATAINHLDRRVDPVWLMGASAFAFRIWIAENLCPSAMSVFPWADLLPEAVAQYGRDGRHISRLWQEADQTEPRRSEAHTAIVEAIDGNTPAVVWDIYDGEWGLIVGYDEAEGQYYTLTWEGKPGVLKYDRLGKNGIDILSVIIPGEPNGRSREEQITRSLGAAVAHAGQGEWTDRPQYQNGLAAFELWATVCERGALLVEHGKIANVSQSIFDRAAYYARHYYGFRCYARDYLRVVAGSNPDLAEAAEAFSQSAAALKPVRDYFQPAVPFERADDLREAAHNIRNASAAEAEGVAALKAWLASQPR